MLKQSTWDTFANFEGQLHVNFLSDFLYISSLSSFLHIQYIHYCVFSSLISLGQITAKIKNYTQYGQKLSLSSLIPETSGKYHNLPGMPQEKKLKRS